MATNNANSDIEILVGVQGGEDINDGSGAIIARTLKKIAQNISNANLIKVKIDADPISTKKSLQKTLNQADLKLHNVSFGNNIATALQNQLDQLKLTVDIGAKITGIDSENVSNSPGKKKTKSGSGRNQRPANGTKDQVTVDTWTRSLSKMRTEYDGKNSEIMQAEKVVEAFKAAERAVENYSSGIMEHTAASKGVVDGLISAFRAAANEQENFLKSQSPEKMGEAYGKSNLELEKFEDYLRKLNPKALKEFNAEIQMLRDLFARQTPESLKKAKAELNDFRATMKRLGYEGGNIFTMLEGKIKTFAAYLMSSRIVDEFFAQFSRAVQTVIELDDALTDLRIVTGGTNAETKELLATYNQMAQALGATTAATAESAIEWQRQGYSIRETNDLIKNSMVLSVVGMVDSADASQYLTSAIKGYKVEVSDAMSIVDKLTAVDMRAAVSAGGLAEAMARTANSARQAGVDMNSLIGYIASIGEVTQRDMSTVGEALKSIFARYGNVKLGKLIDDDGESLNDFETALNSVDIMLRDHQGQFRNFNDVMIDIGKAYSDMTDVQRSAVATTLGGVRQRENVLVLFENLDKAFGYAEIAANSAGTAMQKFEIYQESITAKQQKMTAAFEAMATTLIDNDLIAMVYDLSAGFFNLVSKLPAGAIQLAEITAACIGLATAFNALKASNLGHAFQKTGEDLAWPKTTGDIVAIYSKKTA